jgi:putative transposase
MAKRSETPSFVLELSLQASSREEVVLLSRLEAARQVLNACLGESLRRLALLRQSKAFQAARVMPKGKERVAAFKKANDVHGFREYDLHAYAKKFGHSWIGEHLDSLTVQALASRVFKSARRYAFGMAGRPRFKTYGQVDSVEGKNNVSGIRWKDGHVEWSGLSLKAILDPEDPVVVHGLQQRIKYVRLVRRRLNGTNRFFVQLVCEGKPYRKPWHKIGTALIGLDQGPSTMAAVAPEAGFALKKAVCEELDDRRKEIRRLQRHLDRQRRANNPENYNPDGTVKKGSKTWKTSAGMWNTREDLAEIHRLLAAHRYSLQGKIVNDLLAIGNRFKTEEVSKKGWQKCFGRSVRHRAPGMLEKRLLRKAESAGGGGDLIPTRPTRLSQVCHCGAEVPKNLRDRVHACPNCGIVCDRDLYSAFLASCVEGGTLDAGRAERLWPGVDALLRAASGRWHEQAKGSRKSSYGKDILRRSLSPVALRMNVGEAHDDVVPSKGRERARAAGTPGTPRL